MAKKQTTVQTEETGSTETTAPEVTKAARVRRVSASIQLPKAGELTGTLTYKVSNVDEPVVISIELPDTTSFFHEAILNGLNSRVGIAYGGETDSAKIVEIINKEAANFAEGKFVSRTSAEKKIVAPEVVIAWIIAVGADAEDQAIVKAYLDSWQKRSDEAKKTVSGNAKVKAVMASRKLAVLEAESAKEESSLEAI